MIKKIIAILFCVLAILPLCSCSNVNINNEKVVKQKLAMDTVISLTAYGPKASDAIDAAFKRIDEIEQIASATITDSDVSKINQAAGKSDVKVHPEILKMIQTSIKYYNLTDGAFDITVGPLIKLWGIGTDNERVPSADEINAVLPLVGSDKISINEKKSSVKLLKKDMCIDLGGIAKGYTADEVIKIFKSYGIKSALISMGSSSVYTLGQKPDGTLWSLAIRHPRKDGQIYLGVLKMKEQALSTSGDYERYFINNGKRYHHIFNPATGYPADAGIMSDTIVIDSSVPDCNLHADILTKVTFVLGIDDGFKIINKMPGVACLAVSTDYKIDQSLNWKLPLEGVSSDFKVVEYSLQK